MNLSIIIVSWNVKKLLKENLKAIYKNTQNISFEIFVIDNNSEDGTVEMIKQKFPDVSLIANNYNAGFSKANNQGIRKSKGEYVLLLNPDMRVMPETLEKMIKWMDEHKEAGVASCNLIKENGETILHVRKYPALLNQLAIILKLPHIFPKILDKYLMKNFDYSKEASVDSVRGSFFIIRREVIKKLHGLDERYFIWFEEVDFCRQVKNAGWKIMYASTVKCVDYVGKSFLQIKTGTAQKYFRDSMLKYFKKWHPNWQYWILKITWPVGIFLAWAGKKIKFKSKTKT